MDSTRRPAARSRLNTAALIGTEWLNYDCYIDRVTGELAGVDTMPQEDPEAFEGDLCAELLREEEKAA